MATKLFVGRMSFKTTEEDLRELFAQHGTVESVKVPVDRETERPRGFAFVEMSSEDEAKKAIDALNGYELDGWNIVVNEARPQEDRPRRDFGGDNRGGGYGGGDRGGSRNRF